LFDDLKGDQSKLDDKTGMGPTGNEINKTGYKSVAGRTG
jgi:hypothetical protein